MGKIENSYLVKRGNESYEALASKFDGLKILSISGFLEKGEPVNIYNEQYVDNQEDEFLVTTIDEVSQQEVVIRKNIDLDISFVVSDKYSNTLINVQDVHDSFISYMTNGKLWLKSLYVDREVECACLSGYKPTQKKLKRDFGNYITGTLKLHTLNEPTTVSTPTVGDLYIGFGGSVISTMADIQNLMSLQHYNVEYADGSYSVVCPSNSYLWICSSSTISHVTSGGFEVPIQSGINIGSLRCYRSGNEIAPHTMSFNISTT